MGTMCLVLGACSSGSEDSERTTTPQEAQSAEHKMGEMVEGKGAAFKINKAYLANNYTQQSMDDSSQTETVKPRDNAKFVILETIVRNDDDTAIDPVCGNGFQTKLVTDKDKEYEVVDNIFLLNVNKECENLDPEFDQEVTFVYEIPSSSKPDHVNFHNANVDPFGDELTSIKLDKLSDKAPADSNKGNPNPTPAATAPENNTGGNSKFQSSAQQTASQQPQQSQQNEAAPVSGAPSYGNPCSASQALQPAVGADGTNLVCVLRTPTQGNWVYGPAPSGEIVTDGQECIEGEEGGQDEQGRLLMCVSGQWVYGP